MTKTLSKKPYKGTRDLFPEQKRVQNYLFKIMNATANSFAYAPYDGPLLEEVELYKAKSGEEMINKQIYSFTDRGNRLVAIRPEMTPTLARMVAQIYKEVPMPIRWFSIPNLMRYEKPQRGRLREHWQFNCDIFGAKERDGELEIITMAITLLNNFGADESNFEILINDRTILDLFFSDVLNSSKEDSYRLFKILDSSKKVSHEVLVASLNEKTSLNENKKDLFLKYLTITSFSNLAEFMDSFNNEQLSSLTKSLVKFSADLEVLNFTKYLKFDPTIVRGLDYYTGIVFEIFDKDPNNNRAICGGGSYSDLLKIFNEKKLHGVGFGLGDVTLTNFLISHNLMPKDVEMPNVDIVLGFNTIESKKSAIKLSMELRRVGFKVLFQMSPIKYKKIVNTAKVNISKYLLFFESENFNEVTITNTESKEKSKFNSNNINEIKSLFTRLK